MAFSQSLSETAGVFRMRLELLVMVIPCLCIFWGNTPTTRIVSHASCKCDPGVYHFSSARLVQFLIVFQSLAMRDFTYALKHGAQIYTESASQFWLHASGAQLTDP